MAANPFEPAERVASAPSPPLPRLDMVNTRDGLENQPVQKPLFRDKPYLTLCQGLQKSYPPLKSFLIKLANDKDDGRKEVETHFKQKHGRTPGRCYCLIFEKTGVSIHKDYPNGFPSAAELEEYLEKEDAQKSRAAGIRRLFIVEDLEPTYIEALGHHLGIDPLVFSEQMNTWNYTDSWSIPHRVLPSLVKPAQAFTLRYYELRTLKQPDSIDTLTLQMTFAVNRRRYERWRDIDVPSSGKADRRHGFVRRAASFPTLEKFNGTSEAPPS